MMKTTLKFLKPFPGQISVLLLASAIAIPMYAQQTPQTSDQQVPQTGDQPGAPPSLAQPPLPQTPMAQPQTSSVAGPTPNVPNAKEGFWGRVNPFARKKWVNDRVNPIKDQLSELDEVNAKNARDIQDVDSRAQAGIRHAQSTADTANQTASAANDQANHANTLAQGTSGRIDQLNSTVGGLDQYRQKDGVELKFPSSRPILTQAARKQLDELSANLAGRQGYILEIEAYSPGSGSAGIQRSEQMAEAVKRYLVTGHEIPVYRLHSVALGNVGPQTQDTDQQAARPIKAAKVQIRLMENSLAAK